MPSVHYEIDIEADAEHVWGVIRDVGAVHECLLPGHVAATRVEGARRLQPPPRSPFAAVPTRPRSLDGLAHCQAV
jgi:hypothetical protein